MLKNYSPIVTNNPLFNGVNTDNLNSLLSCMGSIIKSYKKDSFIMLAGDKAERIGLILKGKAKIVKEDVFGNRTIINHLGAGDIFGEVFACAGIEVVPVNVEAETDCDVMLMDYKKIITTCSSNCEFHNTLIKNMTQILADKNLYLSLKNDILSSKTTRDKLMKFFESVATQKNSLDFNIPYNREELADYLSLNRSSMSRELMKMKEEGILDYNKNHITLKKQ